MIDTSVGLTRQISGKRSYPLRWYLVMLVAGTLLPMLMLSAAVIHRLSQEDRAASQRRLALAARDLGWAVDREISSTVRTLSALAQSPALDHGDIKTFYVQAKRAANTQSTWLTTILLTPDGRQILNAARPWGSPLPRANEPVSLSQVVATKSAGIGNLKRGGTGGKWAFPIRVPVMRKGKLKFVLTAVITPQTLTTVIRRHAPADGEWTRTVVDGNGVIVARTRQPERFIGKKAPPSFLTHFARKRALVYREISMDGVPVYLALTPIKSWGWMAGVAVPVPALEATGRRAMTLMLAIGGCLVLLSGTGTFLLARHVSRAIAASATAAEALARGEKPRMHPTRLTEVESLSESLDLSFSLLEGREQERQKHLRQAEIARDQAEAALGHAEEASRLKDEFLATVSHELRTPLTAILGWAHLLRAGHVDKEAEGDTLVTIERNARSLSGIVDDLLDASRIINGQLSIEQMSIDFREIVADAIDAIRPPAEEKNISVAMRSNGESMVRGDRKRLQQIVLNLLSNGVKFTPEGGRIDVVLNTNSDRALLTVRDNGEGIPPQFLPHIFDRFRQADSSTSRRAGGLGLGLAIVHNLVELHGGTVHVESHGEEQGSSFTVSLPVIHGPENDIPEPVLMSA